MHIIGMYHVVMLYIVTFPHIAYRRKVSYRVIFTIFKFNFLSKVLNLLKCRTICVYLHVGCMSVHSRRHRNEADGIIVIFVTVEGCRIVRKGICACYHNNITRGYFFGMCGGTVCRERVVNEARRCGSVYDRVSFGVHA